MDRDSLRNTITFIVLAVIILIAYQTFVLGPQAARRAAEQRAQAAAAPAQTQTGAPASAFLTPAQALAGSPRVRIDTPTLSGTIALAGARIDDLSLKRYHDTIDPKSRAVQLLRPYGAESAFYAAFPWVGADGKPAPGLPDQNTPWTAPAGAVLTPTTPLVLTYDNGNGVTFTRTISVDANYMFAIADRVTNAGAAPVSLAPMGLVAQVGTPADFLTQGGKAHQSSTLVHEGGIGVIAGKLQNPSYTCVFGQLFCNAWKKDQPIEQASDNGWLGITQKYWLAALVPTQGVPTRTSFAVQSQANGPDVYDTAFTGPTATIAPGASINRTTRFFAGPKIVPLLQTYQTTYGIPRFDQAIDWGVYWFFTRPIFAALEFFQGYLVNIGLAILALTVVIRLALFPLANKSYESMSKMRKIQPLVEELKKKFDGDQAKIQQETMAIYQREKINPLMGCLPLLIQIPILYSIYKVLSVTIQMRQAPFFGWIQDMSARDPTTIWNLFGLIPWNPATAPFLGGLFDQSLHVGLLPIVYGFTMWLSTSMSPPAPDPTQQRMMQFLPLIFTFTLAQFTVGLLVYWTWSNVLTILQQYVMMHRFQVENPIDSFIARFTKREPPG
jgi:YidC/Oxa1 family membrane protein insertase